MKTLFLATLAVGFGVVVVLLAKRAATEAIFPPPTGEAKGVAGQLDLETRKQVQSEEVDG